MSVSLIWAQSTSGIIGRDGGIPWQLPEDMARFKDLTTNHTVLCLLYTSPSPRD